VNEVVLFLLITFAGSKPVVADRFASMEECEKAKPEQALCVKAVVPSGYEVKRGRLMT
jgi:hypothetical protein